MDYGINLATAADSWKVVKRAEELGFTTFQESAAVARLMP